MQVAVSIQPLKYFVEEIGGNRVETAVMVPPGANPATYEPRPRTMSALSGARLYFAIGVPFEEAWMERIRSANEGMRVVRCGQGIERRAISGSAHEQGFAGSGGPGSRSRKPGLKDPHIWLSPPLARIVCQNIRDGLVRADPEHRDQYRNNYLRLAREINRVDNRILEILTGKDGKERDWFMVFHPSWGYFADAYGLRQVAIETGGSEPGPGEFARLLSQAERRGVRTIFVQPQFSDKAARTIAAEVGASVETLDPLAERWGENLIEAARKIRKALH
jgi:zinc transport system substrate-binding protein